MRIHIPVDHGESQYLIHLICSGTGAGKTTFSVALAKDAGAVYFSTDEWMANLF